RNGTTVADFNKGNIFVQKKKTASLFGGYPSEPTKRKVNGVARGGRATFGTSTTFGTTEKRGPRNRCSRRVRSISEQAYTPSNEGQMVRSSRLPTSASSLPTRNGTLPRRRSKVSAYLALVLDS